MITSKQIFSLASFTFEVTETAIKSRSRLTEVSDARKAVAHMLKKYLKMPVKDITSQVNRSEDHVGYLLRGADSLLRTDAGFKSKIRTIENGMMGKCCPTCKRPL